MSVRQLNPQQYGVRPTPGFFPWKYWCWSQRGKEVIDAKEVVREEAKEVVREEETETETEKKKATEHNKEKHPQRDCSSKTADVTSAKHYQVFLWFYYNTVCFCNQTSFDETGVSSNTRCEKQSEIISHIK